MFLSFFTYLLKLYKEVRYFFMDNQQFVHEIKELCKKNNISISNFITNCNLRKSFIYDIEKRNAKPSIEIIENIANYFNCSVDYLLGRTDNPEKQSTTNSISGSITGNAIVGSTHSSVIIDTKQKQEPELSKETLEILQIYENLDLKKRHQVLNLIFKLEDEMK